MLYVIHCLQVGLLRNITETKSPVSTPVSVRFVSKYKSGYECEQGRSVSKGCISLSWNPAWLLSSEGAPAFAVE